MGYKFEKYSIGGGGSGGSCIIDVTELPSEYKDVNVYARFDESTYMTFLQVFQSEGITPDLHYYVVDELPTEGKASDFNSLTVVHCYIANNIPYVYGDLGSGNMWVTVSAMLADAIGMPIPDKGFTLDITATTEAGIYVTYNVEGAVYRLTKSGAEVYVVEPDGTYQSLSDVFRGESIITYVVETVPENPINGSGEAITVYVVESTGVAYLGGFGMSVGEYITAVTQIGGGTDTYIDGGWTDDIDAETEVGVYCVRDPSISLNIFVNGAWESYVDDALMVELNEVKLENENLATENENITTQNELLNIKVNGLDATDVGTVNFAKFCSLYKSSGLIKAGGTMNAITQVTIPLEAGSLVEYAFDRNTTLERVTIKTGLTFIDEGAFRSCGMLTSIIYTGTKAQWKAIRKQVYWDDGTPDYTITCTDGTIAKDGTES